MPTEHANNIEDVPDLAGGYTDGELDQMVLSVIQDAANEQVASRGATGIRTHFIAVGGEQYRAHIKRTTAGRSAVLVVLLEYRDPQLPSDRDLQRMFKFTASELRVARLLAARSSNREIAYQLGVTAYTARRHTEHVLRKLGISHRLEVKSRLTQSSYPNN